MGIHDREYYRDRRAGRPAPVRGSGIPSPRRWSANTWLIVVCCAIFIIDGFLPLQAVDVGAPLLVPGVDEVPANAVVSPNVTRQDMTVTLPDGSAEATTVIGREIRTSGGLIGIQRVTVMAPIKSVLYFSTYELVFRLGFWRLLGFQFLHAHYLHLLLNMIGLFFFGPMVERYLGSKRYLAFYLLCGICGALMYCVLNVGGYLAAWGGMQIPGLLFYDFTTPLIGASAGVFGVIMAGAFLAPDARVLVYFLVPVKLKYVAYGLVAIALFALLTGRENAGGEAGHLGGAIAGFYFIRHPHHLHGFFDILGRVDPTSHHYRHGGATPAGRVPPVVPVRRRPRGPDPELVDRVLDKVRSEGLHSLTEAERRLLREASEQE